MSNEIENLKKSHVLQQDQRDCGVACLLSLVRYYGGDSNFEQIRRYCGADLTGTTLLGLKEAAIQLGFEADGYEADIPSLIAHGKPVILHVALEGGLQHYVNLTPFPSPRGEGVRFIIGDPARGVVEWTQEELENLWKSKACLVLEPTANFVKVTEKNSQKKKWFLSLVHEDLPLLAVSAGVGVLVAALGLAMAVYSQQLIDKILPSKNPNRIALATGLVVVLLLARVGLSVLRQFLLMRQSKGFTIRLNTAFYERLLHLPKSFFDTRKIGDFVARLNDTNRIQNTVATLAGNLLVDLMMTLAAFGLLFYYDWRVGLASLLILPIYFWLIYRQNKGLIQAQTNVMVAYSLSESNYINTIQGIADVKNRNKQHFFGNINQVFFSNLQEKIYESGVKQAKLSASTGVAAVLFIAVVLVLTVKAVYENQIKIGEMTAILSAVSMLLPSVTNLALISVPLNDARIAFERMYEFVINNPHSQPLSQNEEGNDIDTFESLKLKDIAFRFSGKKQILERVNFEIKKGEIVAIVGESGGGKSLICQLLQRFYEPESGQIIVNKKLPLTAVNIQQWRNIIGVVPQHVHIFNGTVLDNICFGATEEEIIEQLKVLEHYGFIPFFETLPQGFATLVGEEGINLSGGQRQMIGLARALVAKPQLLVLDEATASLDRHNEKFVLQLIQKLKAQMGIIFITHRLHSLPNFAQRIYVLENGKMDFYGTHQQLMQSQNMYSLYWNEWTDVNYQVLHLS